MYLEGRELQCPAVVYFVVEFSSVHLNALPNYFCGFDIFFYYWALFILCGHIITVFNSELPVILLTKPLSVLFFL